MATTIIIIDFTCLANDRKINVSITNLIIYLGHEFYNSNDNCA